MNRKLLLSMMMVLTASLTLWADVTINSTNFPDANFRSYLLSEYPSGTITTAQLQARTTLNMPYKSISNAKGIEHFTQLTRLDLYSNNLTTVDVSANTKLTYLNVGGNKLTSIDVSNNTALEQLYLQKNNLTGTVIVTEHSALRTLWVNNNPDLKGINCWRNVLTNFDVSGCTALQDIKCFSNRNLSTITGLADCTAMKYLDCEDCSITDLSATQGMSNLEVLYAQNNKLTTLTLTSKSKLRNLRVLGNTSLTELNCYSNVLTYLNVTGCSALKTLRCYYNSGLEAIVGLNDCVAMEYLDCEDCSITGLGGIDNLSNLQTLLARNNKLTALSVNNKSKLTNLRVSGNTLLTELGCYRNALTILNVTGCTALKMLKCYYNYGLEAITGLNDCVAMEYLDCDGCPVTDLSAVRNMPNLQTCYAKNTSVAELDVSGLSHLQELLVDGCTKLTTLKCQDCALSGLGVTNCTAMTVLLCYNNNLKSLDLTGCDAVKEIYCRSNKINGEGATTLVNSLPSRPRTSPGELLFKQTFNDDNNDLTQLDIKIARLKNWSLYYSFSEYVWDLVYSLDEALNVGGGDIFFISEGDYPWMGVNLDGRICAKSGNAGVGGSSSVLKANVNLARAGTLSFDFKAWGEGTSSFWDKCAFSIDGVEKLAYGAYANEEWETVTVDVPAGAHTLTWSYAKDSSVNPDGDYFAVDNVFITQKTMTRGDVDNDGSVNISDVTALIDYLLSGNASGVNLGAADCDQDGSINISDVTALIDFLLKGSW